MDKRADELRPGDIVWSGQAEHVTAVSFTAGKNGKVSITMGRDTRDYEPSRTFEVTAPGPDVDLGWDSAAQRWVVRVRSGDVRVERTGQNATVHEAGLDVVLTGTPADGFAIFGPFPAGGGAADWAENQNFGGTEWWAQSMRDPEEAI